MADHRTMLRRNSNVILALVATHAITALEGPVISLMGLITKHHGHYRKTCV